MTSVKGRGSAVASARIAALFTIVLAIAMCGMVVAPSGAHASSTTCSWFGKGLSYNGVGARNGSFCSTVNGSSYYVYNVNTSFGFALNWADSVCNPSFKIDAYNRYGQWQWWRQGGQLSGCFGWAGTRWLPGIYLGSSFYGIRGGSIRVTLQSSGQSITSNWHAIGW